MNQNEKPIANPFLDAPNGKKVITLLGVYLGLFGAMLVSSGLSTLLPRAAEEIGGVTLYPLASTIGSVTSFIAMPLFGYLAAKNPAIKRVLVAISLFTGALVNVVRAIAPDMMTIIIVSVLYGIVSAGIYVVSFGMIRDMYEGKKAGVFLGMIGTVLSIGMLAGPLLTGLLIDFVSWRAVCHVIWVILTVAGLLILSGVKATKAEAAHLAYGSGGSFDLLGCIALSVFMGGLVLALSLGPSSGEASYLPFGSLGNTALLVLAAVSLIALGVIVAKKGDAAILPMRVLKDRNTFILSSYNLLITFSSMAVFFFMPTYVLYVMQSSATSAALTITLLSVAGIFMGPILGRIIAKNKNARGVVVIGTIIRIGVTAAFVLFLNPETSLILVYVLMFIAGLYNSQHTVTISTAPQIQIPKEIRVLGNSLVQLSQNIGSAIGLAVFTTIIGVMGVVDGMQVAMIIAIATAVVTMLMVVFLKPLKEE